MNREYIIHYEETGTSSPRPHEKKIAKFLTEYFKSDIVFMRRGISKTPDLYILKTNVHLKIITKEHAVIDIK